MSWMAEAKELLKAAHKAKKLKDKLAGLAGKAKKIYSLVDKVARGKLNASDALGIAEDGLAFLATKCPRFSWYVKYHETHFALLKSVMKSAKTTEDAMKVLGDLNRFAKEMSDFSEMIHEQYGYVYEMLDEDGDLPSEYSEYKLPNEFRKYNAYKKEYLLAGEKRMNCLRGPKGSNCSNIAGRRNLYNHEQKRRLKGMSEENAKLLIVVHESSVAVASAFLMQSVDKGKFLKSILKASNSFSKQLKGKEGSAGVITSKAAYLEKQYEALDMEKRGKDSSTFIADLEAFSHNGVTVMSSFKLMGKSYRDVRDLSAKWQKWVRKIEKSYVCDFV